MLIGSGTLLQGLIDVAKKSFEVEVVYGDPFKKVEAPAFLEGVLRDAGPAFGAIGLAMRECRKTGKLK